MTIEKLQKWIISSEIEAIEQELKRKKQVENNEYKCIIDKLKVIFIANDNILLLNRIALIFSTFIIHSAVPLIISKFVDDKHYQEGGTLIYSLSGLRKQHFLNELKALSEKNISYEMQAMFDMLGFYAS